jgi:hypothetical protein
MEGPTASVIRTAAVIFPALMDMAFPLLVFDLRAVPPLVSVTPLEGSLEQRSCRRRS